MSNPHATLFLIAVLASSPARAGDWPAWRHDARHTDSTPDSLPAELHLQWERQLPALSPAWPASQAKLQFDAGYEPVVAGTSLYVGSNADDTVTAYDTRTGEEQWRFYTDGPVRFAPAVWRDRVLATSDDGGLYCLQAETGELLWRVGGGPSRRPILGNGRLVSTWPARGGVVVADGIAYFAAGIWPSMGVFIRAVEVQSGEILWTNSDTSSLFLTHPHGADAFGSISPQGHLAVDGDRLIVPGGRTLPALFDRHTGKLLTFDFGGKGSGGHEVLAAGPFYLCADAALRSTDGVPIARFPARVIADGRVFGNRSDRQVVLTSIEGKVEDRIVKDRRGREQTETVFTPAKQRVATIDGPGRILARAGNRFITAGDGLIATVDAAALQAGTDAVTPTWSADVGGDVWTALVADDRLFVVTADARILCFGAEQPDSVRTYRPSSAVTDGTHNDFIDELVDVTGTNAGFAVVLGLEGTGLIEQLASQTSFNVVGIDADAARVNTARRSLDESGLYGARAAIVAADPFQYELPPYLASLLVVPESRDWSVADVKHMFEILRPYGGAAVLKTDPAQHAHVVELVATAGCENASCQAHGEWTVVRRVGSLPDAGQWTHQYGDASQSGVSHDSLVRAPFGVLWFGGPSNDRVLPRHGHGPAPQVAGGRAFIEGPDMLRAVDVYTGRLWWERDFPGLGTFYDVTSHQPGAGEIGSNYVSLADHVYVIYGEQIHELDAATGETTRTFGIPGGGSAHWGALAVDGDALIAAASPVVVEGAEKNANAQPNGSHPRIEDELISADYSSSSRRLVVFDRHSGEQLWSREAVYSFRHNAICAARGIVYCIDGMSPTQLDLLRRRGTEVATQPKLLALDARTGDVVWSTQEDVFGTFLSYSAEHDVLLQAGSAFRDRAQDEVDAGMVACRGATGDVLWKDLKLRYNGPCLLWKDRIITNGTGGYELDLLTGRPTGWKYIRMYGCNTAIASDNLLTFRSGAAGFCDLAGDSGTGNLGGFRSSCTSNLIVADGVLNAPDYTRTCVCAYQLQTSLAFIHMPDAETWTFNPPDAVSDWSDGLALNFGAPGDRADDQGHVWLEYPSVGGPSPPIRVTTLPDHPQPFRRHSALLPEGELRWVAASGLAGIRELSIELGEGREPRPFTVTLVFSEPDRFPAGKRVFSVSLQGRKVLSGFDPAAEAAESGGSVVKRIPDVLIGDRLVVSLAPADSSTQPPVLSGISLVPESE